ncbi:PP0621 family protein [Acidovorax sp. Leaf160]|uniref:PP0621 family protein n=1 Tax=Acidovorax sp. Leaf160 TaxID=1736280 RepID=UPI0006F98D97|nr:PP0621 family protein [Acidovorax sp. Leaf160]KQR63163.1 hypothetical protein ASF94_01100 [Acidovorax sp. Leaf160]
MKYLLLAVLLVVAWAIWRHQRRSPPPTAMRRPPPALPVDQMVACAHCGTHVPQSEALMQGTRAYCSPQHRLQGPA